jgi:hypothetical protein
MQRVRVMPQFWPHGRGEREMLDGRPRIPAAREGQAETEMRVVVSRAGVHDLPETLRCRHIPAGVELGTSEGFQHAARVRFCFCRALQELSGRRRAAPAEQLQAPLVPRIRVTMRGR